MPSRSLFSYIVGLLLTAIAMPAQAQIERFDTVGASGIFPYVDGHASVVQFDGTGPDEVLLTGLDESGVPRATILYSTQELRVEDRGAVSYYMSYFRLPVSVLPVWRSRSVWLNLDGGGGNDLILMGAQNPQPPFEPVMRVYHNMNGSLTPGQQLPGLHSGAMVAGRLFGGNTMHVLAMGHMENGSLATFLLSGDGTGQVTVSDVSAQIIPTALGAVAMGDCDADGDLDVAVSGVDARSFPMTTVYRNDGQNAGFSPINTQLAGVYNSAIAFGDIDMDGDADLVMTGATIGPNFIEGETHLYRSTGCTFTEDLASGLPVDLAGNSAQLADHDGDGDLDLLLNGLVGEPMEQSGVLYVFNNDGARGWSLFDRVQGGIYGNATWINANEDDQLDVLVTGIVQGELEHRLYRKPGPGNYER